MVYEIKQYNSFNRRRYSNPWVAKFDKVKMKIDFSVEVGGYTGRYNAGEEGSLYIREPIEGAIYAYGQKDYRGGRWTELTYAIFKNGKLTEIRKEELIKYCN